MAVLLTRSAWVDVHLWSSLLLTVWSSLLLTALIVGHLFMHPAYSERIPRLLGREEVGQRE